MSMSAEAMKNLIRSYQSPISPVPNEGIDGDTAYADRMLVAMCQGIIDEIISGAVGQHTEAGTHPHVHPDINIVS